MAENDAATDGLSVNLAQVGENPNMFPCLYAINPHMRTTEGRLQTFLDNASIWTAHRIRATPQQIVDAGMYYLGERDRVKCWYCNGGLQNWERDDDPWEEHAKWFPLCEYVLQQKGPDYVHQFVERFPGLRRPILANPASAAFSSEPFDNPHSPSSTPPSSPQIQIVDPHETLQEIAAKVKNDMVSSELVQLAEKMGFDYSLIETALKKRYTIHDKPFPTLQSLVDVILKLQTAQSAEQGTVSAEGNAAQSELRKLEEQRRCKVCREEFSGVVFIPCGHLCCCVDCSKKVEQCPNCREFVREKIRTASRAEGRTF